LRILTISHMFPSQRSQRHGIFICREARFLRAHGIECDFLVGRPWTPWPLSRIGRWRDHGRANPLAPPDGLQARRVSYLRPPGFGFRRFEGKSLALGAMGAAERWHQEGPFDLVLGASMLPDAEAAVAIGKKLALPVATLAVGSDVMIYPDRMPVLWDRLCTTLEQVDLPVGVSESVCARLAETGRCRRDPLCVYLGRDTKAFTPPADKAQVRKQLGWRKSDVIAIYVGGLVTSKGIRELADACEPLLGQHENFRLVCVGDGPAWDVLIGPRAFHLTGRVEPEKVPLLLQGSDFLVLPSHSEGMPQAVLEAMNCGLPVIATNVGGVPEAVVDGETGLLVEARDVEGLRNAIERMITDAPFRSAAGRAGLQRAQTVFDSERNAAVFADALKALVQTQPAEAQSNA